MEVVIKTLNNAMTGVDFRSTLNTNFENIKTALKGLNVSGVTTIIYTDEEITSTGNYTDGTVQIICSDNGVKIKEIVDNEWQLMCEYIPNKIKFITMETEEDSIGYPVINTDDTLEGMPVGYVDGTKVVAGTIIEGGNAVYAVGWYNSGQLTKSGRIKLDQELNAGTPVWVLNGGGWTIEQPIGTGQLKQVIGFVSDDGLYIDIDIHSWSILA